MKLRMLFAAAAILLTSAFTTAKAQVVSVQTPGGSVYVAKGGGNGYYGRGQNYSNRGQNYGRGYDRGHRRGWHGGGNGYYQRPNRYAGRYYHGRPNRHRGRCW